MYGQPNYGPPFGQGPRTPMPPANQQRPPGLPPPPRQYQHGLQGGPPPVILQGTSAIPPPIGQRGPYLHQHGFHASPPIVQQTPPIPPHHRMSNTGQNYRQLPPTGHESTMVSQCYSNAQLTVQHPSYIGTQHLIHPPAFVRPHGTPPFPDMSASRRPLPPPPPPRPAAATQGLTSYETVYSPQPQTGGAYSFPHIPPPPPPPVSNISTPATFGSSVHLTVGGSHMPCMAPMRPEYPQPLVPPLPTAPPSSSLPNLAASYSPGHVDSDSKLPMSGSRDLDSFDEPKDGTEVRCITAVHEGSESNEASNGCQEGSLAGDGLSSTGSLMLYVSPPPHKPLGEKVVHKTERANESPLKASVIDSSVHSLPADFDMEMEDDMTLSNKDGGVSLTHEELDVNKQLHGPQISPERTAVQGISYQKVSCSLSSEPFKLSQGQDVLFEQRQSTIEKSPSRGNNLYSTGAAECTLPSDLEKFSIPLADDQNTLTVPEAAEDNNSDGISNQLNSVRSSFRLLQDYASDSSSDNDEEAPLEDANVIIVPPSATDAANSSHQDTGSNLKTHMGSESPCMTDKGSRPPSESRKSYKAKFEPVPPKVDEFGRLVREDSSNSNSDDSRNNERHKSGRSRIRSRSRSSIDSTRRSSRRRREKRNRSHSWSSRSERSRSRSPIGRRRSGSRSPSVRRISRSRSPTFRRRSRSRSPTFRRRSRSRSPTFRRRSRIRSPTFRRRSRSRSPTFRRAGGFRNGNKRQDRRQIPGCFDFRRGRCFRGASCRYMHHENEKNDTSKHPRSNQNHLESEPSLKSSRIKEEVKHISTTNLPDEIEDQKLELCQDVPVGRKDGQSIKQMEDSLLSDLSPEQASKKFSTVESVSNTTLSTPSQPLSSEQFSSQLMDPTSIELPLPSFSAANMSYASQLPPPPPPPPPPPSQGSSAVHVHQSLRDYNLMPPYPLQSNPTVSVHSYQDSLPKQHSQFSLPLNYPWTSLPPPPPRPQYDSSLNGGTAARGVSSQFQHSHLDPRNGFGSQTSVRPSPTGLPSHSQGGDYLHQMHPPVRDFPRPLLHRDNLGSGDLSSQPFGGPGFVHEDQFTYARGQDLNSSGSFPHGNVYPQPASLSQESTSIKMQYFSGDNFPSSENLNSSSQIDSLSQNQQPAMYGMQYSFGNCTLGVPGKTGVQYPVNESNAGFPGKDGLMHQYSTDILDRNQSSHVDFAASRIPTHHNPYASMVEQPLSSKFSSSILNQEYNAPSIWSQVPVDGQGVGSVGSKHTTSSPSSARAVGQIFPNSDAEQYDPLLDGVELSSYQLNKSDHGQNYKLPSDSNIMERLSVSRQPLVVEEKYKHKEVHTVASATSLDIDEYGETADAEVGVVEDESLSDLDGVPTMAAGEIEIDQRESAGKSKKKKGSRSTRLFKSAIADFVKEMLKPSWRQGNMSKEAFKTIVKKTVDKVSGAMKTHQIPKTQANINHYIDSSQRKLKKLVKGYVDKFVNV